MARMPRPGLPVLAAVAVAAGLAHAFALASPWSGAPAWWLQLVALAVLVATVDRSPSWKSAALLGWFFATAWLAGTFWWLFTSMYTYGGLPAPLAGLAVLALAAFLALLYGVVCGLFKALAPVHWAGRAIVFAALWLLAELARGTWLTGFPWGAAGYAHVDGPLAALAPVVGVYGIGFVAAGLAALLATGPGAGWRARSTAALVLLALAVAPAVPWSTGTGRLDVALLQGNIPQDEKFQPGSGVPMALQWYYDQIHAAKASLVVAPETAIPLLPQQLVPGYLEGMAERYAAGGQALLLGIPLGSLEEGYTNSVLGFAPEQPQPYRYDKHHLVPFGEFIPPFFRWFTEMMNIPLGDFNRGAVGQPSLAWAGERIAPNICYEDLFGEEIGVRFLDPASSPTILVNLSNIGWFGNTVAVDQHLAISRLRALEFERPMVRATNTGATAVIDHRGQVTHRMPAYQRGVLRAQVQGRGGAATPYARWVARWGLWPLWALGFAVAGLAWCLRGRTGWVRAGN